MDLKTLTYTSRGRLGLTGRDVRDIHETAQRLNALDGITGILVFNGANFLQIVEGVEPAIDDLLARLHRDPRHTDIEVHEERPLDARYFPDWSMELVVYGTPSLPARREIESRLPPALSPRARDHVLGMSDYLPLGL
jgi:hypothetical protein